MRGEAKHVCIDQTYLHYRGKQRGYDNGSQKRMNKEVIRLLQYKRIVLDTGPLLLYLIGLFSQNDLNQVGYDRQQFSLLFQFLSGKEVYVTPQVLAEASDLAENEFKSEKFSRFISHSISPLLSIKEEYIEKDLILKKFSTCLAPA
jgi:hypothetical protein